VNKKANQPKLPKKNASVAGRMDDLDSRLLYLERHDESHIDELTRARTERENFRNEIGDLRDNVAEIRSALSEQINDGLLADCEGSL